MIGLIAAVAMAQEVHGLHDARSVSLVEAISLGEPLLHQSDLAQFGVRLDWRTASGAHTATLTATDVQRVVHLAGDAGWDALIFSTPAGDLSVEIGPCGIIEAYARSYGDVLDRVPVHLTAAGLAAPPCPLPQPIVAGKVASIPDVGPRLARVDVDASYGDLAEQIRERAPWLGACWGDGGGDEVIVRGPVGVGPLSRLRVTGTADAALASCVEHALQSVKAPPNWSGPNRITFVVGAPG